MYSKEPTKAEIFVAVLPALEKHFKDAAARTGDKTNRDFFREVSSAMITLGELSEKAKRKQLTQTDAQMTKACTLTLRNLQYFAKSNDALARELLRASEIYQATRVQLRARR